jgi:hypothetical protein
VSEPAGGILLIAHIVAAFTAYGALSATGTFARLARSARDPFGDARLRRFFKPGHNLASRVLYAVPLLGFGILLTDPHTEFSRPYPWIGLGIWVVSIGVATGALWPAERALQAVIASGGGSDSRARLDAAARKIERSAIVLVACFCGAFVVMVGRL